MAKTETAKPQQANKLAEPAPPKQGLTIFEAFESELQARADEIGKMLPTTIPREKFIATTMAAIKQNPALLRATTRSLISAVTKAAQDGLVPDGREGFINVYNTKVKGLDGKESYQDVAQWMPMTHGIRKRAKELDGILIDAQVVYLNDNFLWVQGDHPRIEHAPVPLGKGPRGEKVGAYAIIKREDGTILHREVMDYGQIEKVRSKSKAPNSLMWTDFPEEGYRKTVVRRGMKSVPVSEKLHAVVTSDDDTFDLSDGAGENTDTVIPPRPRRSDFDRPSNKEIEDAVIEQPKSAIEQEKPQAEIRQEPERQAETVVLPEPEHESQDHGGAAEQDAPVTLSPAFEKWYADQKAKLKTFDLVRAMAVFYDETMKEIGDDPDRERDFTKAYEARQDEIKKLRAAK